MEAVKIISGVELEIICGVSGFPLPSVMPWGLPVPQTSDVGHCRPLWAQARGQSTLPFSRASVLQQLRLRPLKITLQHGFSRFPLPSLPHTTLHLTRSASGPHGNAISECGSAPPERSLALGIGYRSFLAIGGCRNPHLHTFSSGKPGGSLPLPFPLGSEPS